MIVAEERSAERAANQSSWPAVYLFYKGEL